MCFISDLIQLMLIKTTKKSMPGGSKFSSSKMKHCPRPSKATRIKPATHSYEISNSPGGWAIFAAAVDDGLVVIETAKGKFLPDGLSLIPLGLTRKRKMTLIQET